MLSSRHPRSLVPPSTVGARAQRRPDLRPDRAESAGQMLDRLGEVGAELRHQMAEPLLAELLTERDEHGTDATVRLVLLEHVPLGHTPHKLYVLETLDLRAGT